jgi:hypothetical protein
MPYIVLGIETTVEICVGATTVKRPAVFADGMVGVLPVFETKGNAEQYGQGRFDILEVSLAADDHAEDSKGVV